MPFTLYANEKTIKSYFLNKTGRLDNTLLVINADLDPRNVRKSKLAS